MRAREFINEHILDEAPLPSDWDASQYAPKTTFKQRLAYALERAKKIGTGSSRVATVINHDGQMTVLKIAKNRKGLAQNNAEASILSDGYASGIGILVPIIDYDEQNPEPTWINTAFAQKATEKQLCSIMRCKNLSQLVKAAWAITGKQRARYGTFPMYMEHIRKDNPEMTDEDVEVFTDYAHKLADLNMNFNVLLWDFARAPNWGLYNGKPVIIDVGFTTEVHRLHYQR